MKKQWLVYASIGLVFGILDWFYLDWLANRVQWGQLGESLIVIPIMLILNYGVWLVPIIPVVVFEARRSEKIKTPILAGVLTWCCALFSYYAYYAYLLSTGKLPNLEYFNIFGNKDESFWGTYWEMFNRIILSQFLEWTVIAVLGGTAIGSLAFWLLRRRSRANKLTEKPS